MQFSQLEREMHNSPLKCTTNNELTESPAKGSSPKLQDQAYRGAGSDEKKRTVINVSPAKPAHHRQSPSLPSSPDKAASTSLYAAANNASENARMEDPSYRSPPQKKFSSPKRSSAMANSGSKAGSPAKQVAPFGKPIEIIKSKYYFSCHCVPLGCVCLSPSLSEIQTLFCAFRANKLTT